MRVRRLDGVRGLAILMIILSENSFIDLGWTGVELLFVLSGFLLTKILRQTRFTRSYWSSFYSKRTVRIFPVLFLFLGANLLASRHVSLAGMAGYALLFGDIVAVSRFSGGGTLGVLWALAVGAHFIVLWTVAVRFLSRRVLLFILGAILVAEPLTRYIATPYFPTYETIFFLTPFRLDSIVAGSLLAIALESEAASDYLARIGGWATTALAACFLLISHLFPWFIRSPNTSIYNTSAYSMLASIYFFFVAWTFLLERSRPASRFLSWTPLVYLGRISYPLYLFHPFIVAILKRVLHLPFGVGGEPANRKIFPLVFLLSFALSALMYRLIQTPLRLWAERRSRELQSREGDPISSEEEAIHLQG